MAAPSCSLAPQIGGEDSKMYTELLELINNRPLTSYIYACYLLRGASKLDALGKPKNKQGEHEAKDVYDFFNVKDILDVEYINLDADKKALGAVDSTGKVRLPISQPADALNKAKNYNDTHKGTVAGITFDGVNYWWYVGPKDTRTVSIVDSINKNKAVWDYMQAQARTHGINLEDAANDEFAKRVINPANSINIYSSLVNISQTDNKYLDMASIRTILLMNTNITVVNRVLNSFGNDIDLASREIKEVLIGRSHPANEADIKRAITAGKSFIGWDFNAIAADVSNIVSGLNSSDATMEKDKIKELANNFNIDMSELNVKMGTIESLEDAAARALSTLTIRQRELRAKSDKTADETAEAKLLHNDILKISKDIASHKYASSCFSFLANAQDKIGDIQNLVGELSKVFPTKLETALYRANIMKEITQIFDGYYQIVAALSKADTLDSSQSVSLVDRNAIQTQAESILEELDKAHDTIDSMAEKVLADILSSILGTTHDGKSVSTLLKEADLDSHIMDHLYAFSRSSNDIVAAMGTITRKAQDRRNYRREEIRRKLTEADIELRKKSPTGKSSTAFMYEKDNKHLISFIPDISAPSGYSSIDWDAFDNAKQAYKEYLESQGNLTNEEIGDKLREWEYKNTMSFIVDVVNGRTERIPGSKYRKEAPTLRPEQKEYYDNVMALKAEHESMAPTTAQEFFRPPQVRRSFGDVLFNPRGIKDLVKGTASHFADNFRFTVNDQMTVATAEGKVIPTNKNYRGEEERYIPIYHVTRLKNPNELLTDFTSALQSECYSILNYDELGKIVNAVEFMKDYVVDKINPISKHRNKEKADTWHNKNVMTVQKILTIGKEKGMVPMIDSYLGMQFYGEKVKDAWYTAGVLKLIGYTSVTKLALNLKGMISNALMGEAQNLIESIGAEFFNPIDYVWAHGVLIGAGVRDAAGLLTGKGRIWDIFSHDVTNYDMLLSREFGMMPDQYREVGRYYRNPVRCVLQCLEPTGGYAMGEHMIHHIVGYSVLHNTKVLIDGKKSNMYHAFNKVGDVSPHLELKNNVTDLQGNPITEEDIERIRNIIRYCNQTNHGSMTEEEKGVLAQKILGRSALNFRQWMIEVYSKRFRDTHFDGGIGEHRTGSATDTKKWFSSMLKDMKEYGIVLGWKYHNADAKQKANLRRFFGGVSLFLSLLFASRWLYPKKDEDEKGGFLDIDIDLGFGKAKEIRSFWDIMGEYQMRRTLMELASTEIPVVGVMITGVTLMQNPIPWTSVTKSWWYILWGLCNQDIMTSKVYPDKGGSTDGGLLDLDLDLGFGSSGEEENVYWHNIKNYVLPFYKDIKEWSEMDEDAMNAFDMTSMLRGH